MTTGWPLKHSQRRSCTQLELSASRLTDAGMATLMRFPTLGSLDLSHLPLTDAGLTSLAQIKTLKWLDLGATRATPAGLATLGVALPGCNVNTMILMSGRVPATAPPPREPAPQPLVRGQP